MYTFHATLNTTIDDAIEKVTLALQEESFGVMMDLDIAGTLKKKIDVDKRPYHILGACNPKLANDVLDKDANVGALLPCNVIVREEEDGSITVAFMDPLAVLTLVKEEGIEAIAKDVHIRLTRVRDALLA